MRAPVFYRYAWISVAEHGYASPSESREPPYMPNAAEMRQRRFADSERERG